METSKTAEGAVKSLHPANYVEFVRLAEERGIAPKGSFAKALANFNSSVAVVSHTVPLALYNQVLGL